MSSSSSEDEGEDDEDIEVMIRRLNRLKRRLIHARQNEVTKKEEVDHMVMTVAREVCIFGVSSGIVWEYFNEFA